MPSEHGGERSEWRFAAHVTVQSKLIIKIDNAWCLSIDWGRFLYIFIHILFTYFDCIYFNWCEFAACIINVQGLYCRQFWPPFVCVAVVVIANYYFHLQSKTLFTDCFFFSLQEVFRALQFQQSFPLKSLQNLKFFVYTLVTVLQSTARLMIQVQMFLCLFLNTCHQTIYEACKKG